MTKATVKCWVRLLYVTVCETVTALAELLAREKLQLLTNSMRKKNKTLSAGEGEVGGSSQSSWQNSPKWDAGAEVRRLTANNKKPAVLRDRWGGRTRRGRLRLQSTPMRRCIGRWCLWHRGVTPLQHVTKSRCSRYPHSAPLPPTTIIPAWRKLPVWVETCNIPSSRPFGSNGSVILWEQQ